MLWSNVSQSVLWHIRPSQGTTPKILAKSQVALNVLADVIVYIWPHLHTTDASIDKLISEIFSSACNIEEDTLLFAYRNLFMKILRLRFVPKCKKIYGLKMPLCWAKFCISLKQKECSIKFLAGLNFNEAHIKIWGFLTRITASCMRLKYITKFNFALIFQYSELIVL